MKNLLGYLPLHFLCFLILGITFQWQLDIWNYGTDFFFYIFFSLWFVGAIFRKSFIFKVITWFTFFLLGIFLVYHGDPRNNKNYYQNFLTDSTTITLQVDRVLKTGINHHQYFTKVIQLDQQQTTGNVLLHIQKDSLFSGCKIGDRLLIKNHLIPIQKPSNPHQFDYQNYLSKKNIYQQVFVKNQQVIFIKSSAEQWLRIVDDVRIKIQKSLKNQHFSQDEFAVINALILGQRQEISKELINDYSKAGAIHILAVSGLHVGIILLIFSYLLKPLEWFKKGKVIKFCLLIIFLWFFALLAGMSASVVRAVTMFSAVAFGQFINRKNAIEQSLVLSMFLLLLVKPMFLFDVGFQLSYLAVFGIIWIQPVVYNLWQPRIYILRKAWQILSVSIAAQFGVLPLSLYYFHQFPGLFLISNLVIIPFMGVILTLGIIIIMLTLASKIPELLVDIYSNIISILNQFVGLIASQEKFLFTEISFSGLKMIVAYLITVIGFQFYLKRNGKILLVFLGSILIFQGVFWYEKYSTEIKNEFVVFHQSRNSMIGQRTGKYLKVYHDLDSLSRRSKSILNNYKTGEQIHYKTHQKIPTLFFIGKQPILIINKNVIYDLDELQYPIIVLQQSPKINMERLIKTLQPRQIVADGSNYKSMTELWEISCKKNDISFWSTYKKGAYSIQLNQLN